MNPRRDPDPSPTARELLARVPTDLRQLLDRIVEQARTASCELAWVGGGVRDLVRADRPANLDLVVVGQARPFARRLAAALGAPLAEHPRFDTATLSMADGMAIDLAAARRERYAEPGALPTVEAAGLLEDLRRRDFAANALALRLAPGEPELLDPLGGVADIRAGRLRVLHPDSFRDDPTRILRGVRFEVRFGWRLAPETERLAREAICTEALSTVSGRRLAHELDRTCERLERLADVFARLADLGVLAALDPALAATDLEPSAAVAAVADAAGGLDFAAGGRPAPRLWLLGLLAIAHGQPIGLRGRLAAKLDLDRHARAALLRTAAEQATLARLLADPGSRPHATADALDRLESEELAVWAATGEAAAAWVGRYLSELAAVRLTISGGDLLAAGLEPGPEVGLALRRTLDARRDGLIEAAEELRYAVGGRHDG